MTEETTFIAPGPVTLDDIKEEMPNWGEELLRFFWDFGCEYGEREAIDAMHEYEEETREYPANVTSVLKVGIGQPAMSDDLVGMQDDIRDALMVVHDYILTGVKPERIEEGALFLCVDAFLLWKAVRAKGDEQKGNGVAKQG